MTSRPERAFTRPPATEADPAGAVPARVLCLGNELLGDDAFGIAVAARLRQLPLADVEIVDASVTGFHLLDHILGTRHLLVIDTVLTGTAAAGTIYRLEEKAFQSVPGPSPHYIGLFETLAVARRLGLSVPEDVTILAVEAADCTTLGGAMNPAVVAAMPVVIQLAKELLESFSSSAGPEENVNGGR